MTRNLVPLTVALPRRPHTSEIASGGVELAAIDATFVDPSTLDADVIELALVDVVVGSDGHSALPVFPSRSFLRERDETDPTAAVYVRGPLAGVAPTMDDERAWQARTGVFPILTALAVRTELLQRYRWLATNIYRAFEVARRRSFARLEDIRGSRVPIPSIAAHVRSLRQDFGGEVWPYGVEPNRPTLEAFVRHAHEQGVVASAPPDVAGLFVPVEPFVDYTDGV